MKRNNLLSLQVWQDVLVDVEVWLLVTVKQQQMVGLCRRKNDQRQVGLVRVCLRFRPLMANSGRKRRYQHHSVVQGCCEHCEQGKLMAEVDSEQSVASQINLSGKKVRSGHFYYLNH